MADTLLNVVNEILRETQQAQATAFSENDDTNYIVDRVNDALDDLYALKGTPIDADGTITITPSTRTFSGPSGLDLHRIYDWTFRIHDTDGDIPVAVVTEEYITRTFPLFETFEATRPDKVYIDNNLVAVYPLLEAGASNLTLQFSYPAQFVKLTSTSATFPFPDRSEEMRYIKLHAKFEYEKLKGFGQPGDTRDERDGKKAQIIAKYARLKRVGFTGYRVYGN